MFSSNIKKKYLTRDYIKSGSFSGAVMVQVPSLLCAAARNLGKKMLHCQQSSGLPSMDHGLSHGLESALERIADEFGVFTGYVIKDVDVKLEFSRSNLNESVSKEITPDVIAKLLPLLKNAVENAIGIESHSNRYFYDTDTVRFDNLIGGFVDGKCFIPVRFGLKHRRNGEVILYVIVDQQKIPLNRIKAEVFEIADAHNAEPEISHSAFKISISDIVPNVNGRDLLRYSDYGKTAAKHSVDKVDFWAELVDDFLDDRDAEPDKVGRYWRDIVRH